MNSLDPQSTRPLFQPPNKFRPIARLQWAEMTPNGPFDKDSPPRYTGARAEGIRYERRVHEAFSLLFPPVPGSPLYFSGQWIRFVDSGRMHWAQPDGLLVDFERGLITILEIKLRHTQSAWFSLRQLYEPLIRYLFGPRWRYAVCEIVRWFEPRIPWPEPMQLTPSIAMLGANEFGVHIWNGTRNR